MFVSMRWYAETIYHPEKLRVLLELLDTQAFPGMGGLGRIWTPRQISARMREPHKRG